MIFKKVNPTSKSWLFLSWPKNVLAKTFVSEIRKAHFGVRMERRDQDTICNPSPFPPPLPFTRSTHDVSTCFLISLSQHVPATCQHIEERGRTPVYSRRESGRKGKGEGEGWGERLNDPFPFSYRAFLSHLLPLPFLRKPRRLACLLGCLLKDSVTHSNLYPSDATKRRGYFLCWQICTA